MNRARANEGVTSGPVSLVERIRRGVVLLLVVIMAGELALVLWRGQWLTAFLVAAIMAITLSPIALWHRIPVRIPPEFQIVAVLFIFAALFLGEVRNFYERVWWWDVALHASSGLLMGMVGFLLVYVLNESARVEMYMRPAFVAFFAFLFSVTVGTTWEIFEFAMDRVFDLQMQKSMLGDASGLTDTMWDLIVDSLAALLISVLGWTYMHRRRRSFMDGWIRRFITANPRLFRP